MYTYLRAHLSHILLSATRSAQHACQVFRPTRHPPCEGAFTFLHFPLPGHFARLRSRPAIGAACPADRHTAPPHGRLRPLRNGDNRSRLGRGRARDTPIPGTTHLPSSEWNVPYPIGFHVPRRSISSLSLMTVKMLPHTCVVWKVFTCRCPSKRKRMSEER